MLNPVNEPVSPALSLVKDSTKSVALSGEELKDLWSKGILSDTAYVALIFKLDEKRWHSSRAFDFQSFILEWEAFPEDEDEKTKSKTLKVKAIRDAIDKMAKADLIQVEQQMSLQLTW